MVLRFSSTSAEVLGKKNVKMLVLQMRSEGRVAQGHSGTLGEDVGF